MSKQYIEPRHNMPLSCASLIFSILIAPIGIILSIISLVRIAKNKLDNTIDTTDKKSQIISVISLVISIAITIAISVMYTQGTTPWQIYEQEQTPIKIAKVLDDNMQEITEMSEKNKDSLGETIQLSFTTNDIDPEELGVSGRDIVEWALSDITYTYPEITYENDTADVDVLIHHRNVNTFTANYADKFIEETTTSGELPSTQRTGEILKDVMDNTDFIDETVTFHFVKTNGQWTLTQESTQEIANIIFGLN